MTLLISRDLLQKGGFTERSYRFAACLTVSQFVRRQTNRDVNHLGYDSRDGATSTSTGRYEKLPGWSVPVAGGRVQQSGRQCLRLAVAIVVFCNSVGGYPDRLDSCKVFVMCTLCRHSVERVMNIVQIR